MQSQLSKIHHKEVGGKVAIHDSPPLESAAVHSMQIKTARLRVNVCSESKIKVKSQCKGSVVVLQVCECGETEMGKLTLSETILGSKLNR